MDGPGAFLEYRALHIKIGEVQDLKVPRNILYDMMYMVNPTGLDERPVLAGLKDLDEQRNSHLR